MAESSQHYLTQERHEALTAELEELKTSRRKEVAENLEYAKKLGDLSENAEYHEARERQAEVEDRIRHLEAVLKTAKIVDGKGSDTVAVGSTVTLGKDGESSLRSYRIVGSEEADTDGGKLSNLSPLGSALLGRKKGDTVKVKTPKGVTQYTVIEIQ